MGTEDKNLPKILYVNFSETFFKSVCNESNLLLAMGWNPTDRLKIYLTPYIDRVRLNHQT